MTFGLLPLGWVHSLACVAAMALGFWLLAARKGGARHRRIGQAYVLAQVVLNLTALGVYRLHVFFFPHVLAIATLAVVALGWAAARWRRPAALWRHLHLSCMILSYYLLIGGGVNEVFLHVNAAREYVRLNGGEVIAQTQLALRLVFTAMLLGWNAVEIGRTLSRRSRRRDRPAALA